jgi:molybdopterin converting factor subunit 1
MKKVHVKYFASLRESAGKSEELIELDPNDSIKDLYNKLVLKYDFALQAEQIKFSLNNEYVDPHSIPKINDIVVFIPPVSGG